MMTLCLRTNTLLQVTRLCKLSTSSVRNEILANQVDFTTLATKAEDLKRDLKAGVQCRHLRLAVVSASCVNTTARQVFHADDATGASQGDTRSVFNSW